MEGGRCRVATAHASVRRALPRAQIDRPLGSKAAAVTMEISAHIVSLQSVHGCRGGTIEWSKLRSNFGTVGTWLLGTLLTGYLP